MNAEKIYVITFYKIVEIENYYDMKLVLLELCKGLGMKGTIVLSTEGITLTVCCNSLDNLDQFIAFLKTDERFADLPEYCLTHWTYEPFAKMIVRLKLGVVNMGSFYVDMSYTGKKVQAEEWDELISKSDVSVLDVRNDYEGAMGGFTGAAVPDESTFARFPEWWKKVEHTMNKKIAMFCTGGIRCEKAGAWLASKGYEVYNLYGGILHYLEKKKGADKSWKGDCFVFDDRVAVDGDLNPNAKCRICGQHPSIEDLRSLSRADVVCSKCQNNTHHSTGESSLFESGCEA